MKIIKLHSLRKALIFTLFALLFILPNKLYSQHQGDNTQHETEKFQPGPFIFNHIADAYEWHIATFGNFHLSLPLPVIVYSKEKGLNFFMSSKFHHGHVEFKGFKIETNQESEYKGKIVEILADGSVVRPIDISITKNTFALFFSAFLLILIFVSVAKAYKKNKGKAPKGLQSFLEPLIMFVRDDIAKTSIQKNPERYMPFLLSIFFFILLNNLLGLVPFLPGGTNLTGNISITLVLAVFTFIITTFVANKNYWKHIINAPGVPWWLKFPIPLMPFVEILGMFTKPFVLMVRLFANITAGHIIALGFYSLIFIFGEKSIFAGYGISIITVLFTIFMMMLELLVAFIQAYVFTLLSALYFGMATEEHH
ncbi:MAG: F0F1 ATP synthase subunit A [Bacteroidales bacterium]|nr:F0F1 ATP synthase subunit A [Bacteroidales bacterium]MBN2756691.1 F0F1 ATP synthase subunit A [Bacteroidales bacterium]